MYRILGVGMNSEVLQRRCSQLFMIALGLLALAAGTMVYVVDRPATSVYFIPDSFPLAASTPLIFGVLGDYLPAFFHALAFALFAGSLVGRRYIGIICLGWFVAEVFFEVAQLDAIAFTIAGLVPGWFAGFPLLENIPSHFVTGVFDTVDVLFLFFGCGTAFAIGKLTLPRLRNTQAGPRAIPRPVRIVALLLVTFVGLTSIVGSGGTGTAVSTATVQQVSQVRH